MRNGQWARWTAVAVAAVAAWAAAGEAAKDTRAATSAAELWRRGNCILSSVVVPARKQSRVPRALRGAKAVEGRTFALKVQIAAWTRDERTLWAATDTEVHQIELTSGRVVRSYARSEGLPDWPVDELVSDGRTLWIVHRRGLASLPIGEGKVVDRADVRFRFARLHRDGDAVWVISDAATHRFAGGASTPKAFPALPTGQRIRRLLKDGVWLARRRQATAYCVADPVSLGGRLYAASFGALYELADGAWRRVAAEGWSPRVGHGSVWFLTSRGLARYDPKSRATKTFSAPEPLPVGRPTHLAVTRDAVWVAVEPRQSRDKGSFEGGGLARLDVASGRWQTWGTINGRQARRVTALGVHDGALWAAAADYRGYRTLSAHPGMMHVKRSVPVFAGLCLHRFASSAAGWQTVDLGAPACERRLILGQRGKKHDGVMIPRLVTGIAVGRTHVFGAVRLFPRDYYSGYYTSVDQLATRKDSGSAWQAKYVHQPEQLNLQGEQPAVLLISESHGKRVVYADGHDRVVDVFTHQGRPWTVTEGCVARFDPAAGRWQKVLETGFRFYWKATAALDDGRRLWVGSDRGLVARLDLSTNRFTLPTALKGRTIGRIAKDAGGRVVVAGRPAARGRLPDQLEGKVAALDADAAVFDGQTWKPTKPTPPPLHPPVNGGTEGGRAAWSCEKKSNFLLAIDPATGRQRPAFYLTGVFQPRFLCASPDGRRIWVGTYSGLVRVDR